MPGIVEQPSTIPVIDLSDFETRKEEVSQQLLHAARDVGFFYVSGHGIPDAEVDKVFEEVRTVSRHVLPKQVSARHSPG